MGFKLAVVNYHYIREEFPNRGVFGVTPKLLKYQISALLRSGFKFISLSQLELAIRNETIHGLPNKSCLISFDDGLRESFEIGKPILDSMSIPAAYFISTGGITNSRILNVHAMHLIQQNLHISDISNLLDSQQIRLLRNISESVIANQYPWDDFETGKIKYLFNFLLNEEGKRCFIHKSLSYIGLSENIVSSELYMNTTQIKILGELKWLGSHGVTHNAFSALTPSELETELIESKKTLKSIGDTVVNAVAYPFGGQTAFNENVLQAVASSGYICGMTMLRGFNSEIDILKSPLALRRFDTNDLYGGKSHAKYVQFFNED
jgi:peptidoglycan/xylan/chitin deacetylase (PgdA/CDA1 family)